MNNNNNANFQRALEMSIGNAPQQQQPMPGNNNMQRALAASRANANNANNAQMRAIMEQSAAENRMRRQQQAEARQREREARNAEYEEAMRLNALAAQQRAQTPPAVNPRNFNRMLPNLQAAAMPPALVKAMRVATPEETAALSAEFPMFPYNQIERILLQKKGNVNATRQNLVRRKTVLGKGGRKTRSNGKRSRRGSRRGSRRS